jgi:preprotein translocase subunit Sec61beta
MVTVKLVKDLDLDNIKPLRAGILPYFKSEEGLFWCFGVDTRTLELTDFGGGVIYKKDKNAINGAIREFKEETLGIFDSIKIDPTSIVIYNKKTLIILVQLESNTSLCREEFLKKVKSIENPEVCDLDWISNTRFLKLLTENIEGRGRIYVRIRDLLRETQLYLDHL